MRTAVLLSMLVLFTVPAWGNGEPIRYDRNTGIVVPDKPTPARVERERLDIEFQPLDAAQRGIRQISVRAEYELANPTDKPLDIDIGFPVPGQAVDLVEPPVRFDGHPIDWRLLDYEAMLKPVQPDLIRAMKRWAGDHPRLVQLAEKLRQRSSAEMRQQFEAESKKAGLDWVDPLQGADQAYLLRSADEADRYYKENPQHLRGALILTGQRDLLPEGRWLLDQTVLDPATGREMKPAVGGYLSVSLITFHLRLQPQGHHRLLVKYRQPPSWDDRLPGVRFSYILTTVGGWASFGPIDVTAKAPPRLVFRSSSTLRHTGKVRGFEVYSATIPSPKRNLQMVLGTKQMLWPRLKVNGRLQYSRFDCLAANHALLVPLAEWDQQLGPLTRRKEGDQFVASRGKTTVRARYGEKSMLVDARRVPLSTPVELRSGTTCVPAEVLRALYPEYRISLTYHAPTHTVLFGCKPKPGSTPPPQPARALR